MAVDDHRCTFSEISDCEHDERGARRLAILVGDHPKRVSSSRRRLSEAHLERIRPLHRYNCDWYRPVSGVDAGDTVYVDTGGGCDVGHHVHDPVRLHRKPTDADGTDGELQRRKRQYVAFHRRLQLFRLETNDVHRRRRRLSRNRSDRPKFNELPLLVFRTAGEHDAQDSRFHSNSLSRRLHRRRLSTRLQRRRDGVAVVWGPLSVTPAGIGSDVGIGEAIGPGMEAAVHLQQTKHVAEAVRNVHRSVESRRRRIEGKQHRVLDRNLFRSLRAADHG